MDKNVLLTIAYDGSVFHGWQKQPNQRTVQGHLEKVMSGVFGREILLSGTSRTDAGVHALGQRASFKADLGIPTEKIALVVNNALCASENAGGYAKAPVRILKSEDVPEDFHARFNCKGKTYGYRITGGVGANGGIISVDGNAGSKDEAGCCDLESKLSLVFDRSYTYHLADRLDVQAMNEAAGYLVGTQDFKSFEAAGGNPRETTVRTISQAAVSEVESRVSGIGAGVTGVIGGTGNIAESGAGLQQIEFHVTGDGFLYNMVRIITGTLVEVGLGKKRPEELPEIIHAKDRSKAGHTAPPGGLYLAEVYYE